MKTIQIEVDGKMQEAEIKRFSFKERNEVYRESLGQIKMIGTDTQATIDPWKLQEVALQKGLVKAWFPVSKEAIEQLDFAVADKLYQHVAELNNLGGTSVTKKSE